MEYTPSQKLKIIEKQKPIIFKALETIDENVAFISTDEGYNIMCKMHVDEALQKLSKALEIVSDLIIDTDDYPLGVEIFEKLMPIWGKYCTEASKGEFRIHEAAYQVQSIINYFRKWIKKKEPKSSDSLAAFEELAHECIAFIGLKFGTRKARPKSQKLILEQWDSYRNMVAVSGLTYEIRRHIESCKTSSETDQYIYSLLLPFKELCQVLRPPTPTEESQKFITLLCTGSSYHGKDDPDSIERVLYGLLNDMNKFAKGLYDVLIQNGIDLNEYQKKTGVYLRKKWNPAEGMLFELDNWDLIESLSQEDTPPESPSENSYIINEKIDNALPNLYDLLVEEGVVSNASVSKQDFENKIKSADVPTLEQHQSYWVLKIIKFKSFIKCIRKCFNADWYKAVCTSAGLTKEVMGSYNTSNTSKLEKKMKEILKQNGIE